MKRAGSRIHLFSPLPLLYSCHSRCRCIAELNSTYFLHEIVKRGISLTLDGTEEKRVNMSELYNVLVAKEIMSKEQVNLGFTRALESADDLSLDIPNAKTLLNEFIQRAIVSGILPPDFGPSSS
jgi:hypothetical protein